MTEIIVFGAGKTADVVHASMAGDPAWSIAAFACDREFIKTGEHRGIPVVAFEDVQKKYPPAKFAMFVAVGYHALNSVRAERCRAARAMGYRLVSWISPRAHVPKSCTIGANCLIMDGAALQPYARLGDGVFVWNNAVVGHHATVGDYCWLASNATVSSSVVMESGCFVGVNAAIGHDITIGASSIFGAGAVITRSVAPDGVYIAGDTERFRLDSQHFIKLGRIT